MLNLVNEISITNTDTGEGYSFNFVTEIEIESSWDMLTDTAQMKLPKNIRFKKDGQVINNIVSGDNPLFKRGFGVSFVIGYGGQTSERFEGYISNINPRNPLEFEFQDEMYKLKQKTITAYSKKDLSLSALLGDIMGETPFTVNQDFTIGKYVVKSATVAQILEHLRKNYGVVSYFRGGELQSGLAYGLKGINEVKVIPINVESVVIDNNLIYQRDDDQKIKIIAVGINDDNTKIKEEAGDADGGEITQYYYGATAADLKIYAQEALEKRKYTGFNGSFSTFANPVIKHGDAVELTSTALPDANGTYLVKKVVTTAGLDGGRQIVELDVKI